MSSRFGVFAPVFESSPCYLHLLRLSAVNIEVAVRSVIQCAQADTDRSVILKLLADVNWRPTLVAAVAAPFLSPDSRITAALWHRVDTGSWVTPQIAVVLALIDPDFETVTRRRLEAHCPLDSTELRSLTSLERHSFAGPAGGRERSAKAASALAAIVADLSSQPTWLAPIVADAEHQSLVASDIDDGAMIARNWGKRFAQVRNRLQL